ncbi:hypothetical protein WMY93_022414 [Mugilogobius chulae]|uniref:Uncharacterized protein n=1 Tax=Mugilogobius chulae TaxID=88201 RepID=A0AAW0NH38_9GOBI
MDPGPCGLSGAAGGAAGGGAAAGGGLESSLPQSDPPCLIVEDSQPDSIGIEDDPETSYRSLLNKRLSSLQPRDTSPVLVREREREREGREEKRRGGGGGGGGGGGEGGERGVRKRGAGRNAEREGGNRETPVLFW